MPQKFTEEYLRSLVAVNVMGDFPPFLSGDKSAVKAYARQMIESLDRRHTLKIKPDYNSYGSGYASYINIEVTQKDKSDTVIRKEKDEIVEHKSSLLVYVSKLVPYWYFGGMQWTERYKEGEYQGGSGSFLRTENITKYDRNIWQYDIDFIQKYFCEYGYELLSKEELQKELWFKTDIDTFLGQKPYEVFDCFFYWND
jgi:hypothetical protein